jgi:hypothetical protein
MQVSYWASWLLRTHQEFGFYPRIQLKDKE